MEYKGFTYTLTPKTAWDNLSMLEKSEMMKVSVRNGITDLKTVREKYNEFAEGGDTKWTMEDEARYMEWRQSLPDNLRLTNDNDYDMRAAFKAGMQPVLESDGLYHLESRDPETGRILKSPHHPTYLQAINTDARMGYYPVVDDKGQTYTQTWEGNKFAGGGKIHIKPENRGKFTALKKRTGHSATWFKEHGTPAQKKMAVFELNARKWKHGNGGYISLFDEDVNLYGWGDWLDKAYNGVKNAVNKGREVVRTLGLDKSPSNHLMSWMGVSDSDMTNKNQSKNNNLGFFATGALDAGRMSGINKVVKGDKNDIHYRTNLFNMVDPTNAVPDNIIDVLGHAITASQAKSEKTYPYKREHQDATADAAWAKRLGLPYDKALLPDNTDGSVRLSQALEQEIPTDTTLLKNRIADNEKLLTKIYGKKRKPIEVAVDLDKAALNALRETYSTGKPVGLNEFTHNSRGWLDADLDKVVTPLSLLHRYTVQYDKDKNRMNYWDTYDFDEFEDFVPGEPFFIRGSIDLKKKK